MIGQIQQLTVTPPDLKNPLEFVKPKYRKAVVLQAEGCEMLYLDGVLHKSREVLHEGEERVVWFVKEADKCFFDIRKISWQTMTEEDEVELTMWGSPKTYLAEYNGNYDD